MTEMPRKAITVSHKYADVICASCSIGNSITDDGAWYCGHCGAVLSKPERVVDLTNDGIGLAILAATKNVDVLYDVAKELLERYAAAEAALAACEDTKRLNELERQRRSVGHHRDTNRWWSWRGARFETLRAAIDAAIS